MNVTIDKETILHALKSEPLERRNWITGDGSDSEPISDPSCTVCAVGAVLRQVMIPTTPREQLSITAWRNCPVAIKSSAVQSLLKDREYLDALSCYFESLRGTRPLMRKKLVAFVTKYFPEKITVKIRKNQCKVRTPAVAKRQTLEQFLQGEFKDAHIMAELRRQKEVA